MALDCGTGNGQFATQLAKHFDTVLATDISANQLAQAIPNPKIQYLQEDASHVSAKDRSLDLITVAQAVHWFDFDAFYKEVKRVLRPEGVIALIGYGLPQINLPCDTFLQHLYEEILGPYWDPQRVHVEQAYQHIPFPFQEIISPSFEIEATWDFDHWVGFFNSWSATANYIKAHDHNPVTESITEMRKAWGAEPIKTVRFPLFIRIGKNLHP